MAGRGQVSCFFFAREDTLVDKMADDVTIAIRTRFLESKVCPTDRVWYAIKMM